MFVMCSPSKLIHSSEPAVFLVSRKKESWYDAPHVDRVMGVLEERGDVIHRFIEELRVAALHERHERRARRRCIKGVVGLLNTTRIDWHMRDTRTDSLDHVVHSRSIG